MDKLFLLALCLLDFPPHTVLINKRHLKLPGLFFKINVAARLGQMAPGPSSYRGGKHQVESHLPVSGATAPSVLWYRRCRYVGHAGITQMGHTSSPSNPPEVNLCTWATKAYVSHPGHWNGEVTKQASHHEQALDGVIWSSHKHWEENKVSNSVVIFDIYIPSVWNKHTVE